MHDEGVAREAFFTPSIALFFEWVTGRTSYMLCGVRHVKSEGENGLSTTFTTP